VVLQTGKGEKLPDDWFTWIGRVVVEWGRLERAVEGAIWGLLRIFDPEIGQALTTHIPTRVRLDIYLSLADKLLSPQEREDISKLIKRINDLHPDRNLLTHAEWLPWKIPQILKVQARGAVTRSFYEPTIPFLEQLYKDIGKVADELESAGHKYAMRP
jgi:hypothetical protein